MAVSYNYAYNNFISQATSDSKYIKIYDKYGNYKYTIDVMISYYFYKDRYVYIKVENENDITLDFDSSSTAMSALEKLNTVKKTIAQNAAEDTDYYTKTELDLGQLDNRYYTNTAVTNLLSNYSLTSHTHYLTGLTDVQLSGISNNQVLVYQNGVWVNSSFTFDTSAFTSNYYTIVELSSSTSDVYINWSHIIGTPTDASGYGINDVYTTAQTYSKSELNPNPGGPSGSGVLDDRYYTKMQTYTKDEIDDNFLSANTAIYTRSEAENSFLSANTSYYTRSYINSNFSPTSHTHNDYSLTSHTHTNYSLSSHTHADYALTSHTHTNYSLTSHTHNLSDLTNTSHTHLWSDLITTAHTHDDRYYTESEINTLLDEYSLTSHTHDNLYYTKLQVYDKPEIDSLLTALTYNTSQNYYTSSQTNANFLSASTINLFNNYSVTSHTHTLSSLSGVTIATPQNNNFLVYYGGVWVNSAVSFDTNNFYTKTQLDGGQLDYLYIPISGSSSISGDLIPVGDGVYSLGSATNQWKELHVSGGTIYIDSYPITIVDGQLTISGQTILTQNEISGQYSLTSHTHSQYSLTGHNHDTLYYTKPQTYTKSEIDNSFLSANTSFYTTAQTNANFLSANTSLYTQAQANSSFLSANTSFYTTAQTNANFSPTSHTHAYYSLTSHTHAQYSPTSHTHTDYSLSSHTHANYSLTSHTHTDYSLTSHTHNQYSLTSHTHDSSYYTKSQVYSKPETDSNFLSANTSFYTQSQANSSFLSANTSYYTQSQTNSGFLSANTSYYTQSQANSGFLSASTTANQLSAYTQAQANSSFLSANTSFYTQAQANGNFLSATTTAAHLSAYTQLQSNANFLSANTSFYTQSQANSSFLSANTSFYTTAQTMTILGSYSPTSHTHANYSLTSHTHADYSLTSHTHANYSLTSHTHDFTGLTNTAHTHLWSDITNTSHTHSEYSPTSHTHSQYSITSHTHDDRYYLSSQTYSTTEVNNLLTGYYTSAQTNTIFFNSAQTNALYSQTGHSHYLTGLTDVVVSAISYGQVLVYSAGTWINSAVTLDLSAYYTASEVDLLLYNLTGATGTRYLYQLLDVNSGITTASAGESLVFDGALWVNSAVTPDLSAYYTSAQTDAIFFTSAQTAIFSQTGHSHAFSALTDVRVTGATDGQFLQYSGGSWYPVTSPTLVGNFVVKSGDTMTGELVFDFMTGLTTRILHVDTGGTVKEGEDIISLYVTDPTVISYITSGDTYWTGRTFTFTGLTATTYEGQKYIDANYFYEYFGGTFYRTYYSDKDHNHDDRYYTQSQLLPISGSGVLDIRYITYDDLSGLTLQSLADVSLNVPILTNNSFLKWDSTSGWTNYIIDLTAITWKPEGVLTGRTVTGISGLTGGGTLDNDVQIRHSTKTVTRSTTIPSLSSILVDMTFDAYGHPNSYTVADFTGTIKGRLSELNDVIITGPQTDHYLYYNVGTAKWLNGALTMSKVSGLTTELANYVKLNPTSVPQTITGNVIFVNDVYHQSNQLFLGTIPLSTDGTNLLWSGVTVGGSPAGTTGSIQIKSGSTFSYSTKFDFDFANEAITFGVRSGSTGSGSMAYGHDVIASGDYAFATGVETTASGNYSFASGYRTISGQASHAEGAYTTASGDYSHAEGFATTASGYESHAGGYGHLDYKVIAFGLASFNHSTRLISTPDVSGATGEYSVILGGVNNSATDVGSVVIGGYESKATGKYNFATGYQTTASGTYGNSSCFAEGYKTTSSGSYGSHSEGIESTASGDGSHSEGYRTTANGHFSHAEGNYSTSSGKYSHGEGRYGIASGECSHAQNRFSNAIGTASHAGGYGQTTAYSIVASGVSSFNHSYRNNSTDNVSGVTANYSVILGGVDHSVTSVSSAILAGTDNTVLHDYSVILGGYNQTTLSASTVYMPRAELTMSGDGIILRSPNGTRYKVTVDNSGNLITTTT